MVGCGGAAGARAAVAAAAVDIVAAGAAAGAACGASGAMLGAGLGDDGTLGDGGGGARSGRPFSPRNRSCSPASVSRPRRPNISGAPFEPAGQTGQQLLRQQRALLRRLNAAEPLG